MSRSHFLLRFFRQLHLFIGVFISPALLFFAFTGALQTFSLHETTPGSSYRPPKWAMVLAQIHKKATPVIAPKKQPSAAAAGEHGHGAPETGAPNAHSPADASTGHDRNHPGHHDDDHAAASPSASLARAHHPLPLKLFFLLVAIGLFTSTLTGLYMSWKFAKRRHGLLLAVFLAGILVPVALVFV